MPIGQVCIREVLVAERDTSVKKQLVLCANTTWVTWS